VARDNLMIGTLILPNARYPPILATKDCKYREISLTLYTHTHTYRERVSERKRETKRLTKVRLDARTLYGQGQPKRLTKMRGYNKVVGLL
jgi:hypothetical protein